jgi:hypothetical protein
MSYKTELFNNVLAQLFTGEQPKVAQAVINGYKICAKFLRNNEEIHYLTTADALPPIMSGEPTPLSTTDNITRFWGVYAGLKDYGRNLVDCDSLEAAIEYVDKESQRWSFSVQGYTGKTEVDLLITSLVEEVSGAIRVKDKATAEAIIQTLKEGGW